MYNKWCPNIYKGLYVEPKGIDKILIRPCNQFMGGTLVDSSFDFTNNEYLNKFRNGIGNLPNECVRCTIDESNNRGSRRTSIIEFYRNNNIDQNNNVELTTLDYNINWACNLACIMCGPYHSSTWASEMKLPYTTGNKLHTTNNIIDVIDVSAVRWVHFNGGEPLIGDDTYRILSRINNLSRCAVTLDTNATQRPSKKILDIWSHAQYVRVFFSVDAIENAFEYIRYHAKWDKVVDNIQWFNNACSSNVLFGLNVTVGVYNILEMRSLWDWYNNTLGEDSNVGKADFNWQIAYNYDVGVNDEVKHKVNTELENIDTFQALLQRMDDIDANDAWITHLNAIDARRKTNWKKSLKIGEFY